jgi:hypothetical protein
MTDHPIGGVDLRPLSEQGSEDPGGAGGASGGGTIAGAGEPSGGTLGRQRGEAGTPAVEPHATPPADTLAGITDSEIAGEAAALGGADGSLAQAAGIAGGAHGRPPAGPEAVGAGAGRGEVGVGTGGDRSGLAGGDPLAIPNGSS